MFVLLLAVYRNRTSKQRIPKNPDPDRGTLDREWIVIRIAATINSLGHVPSSKKFIKIRS